MRTRNAGFAMVEIAVVSAATVVLFVAGATTVDRAMDTVSDSVRSAESSARGRRALDTIESILCSAGRSTLETLHMDVPPDTTDSNPMGVFELIGGYLSGDITYEGGGWEEVMADAGWDSEWTKDGAPATAMLPVGADPTDSLYFRMPSGLDPETRETIYSPTDPHRCGLYTKPGSKPGYLQLIYFDGAEDHVVTRGLARVSFQLEGMRCWVQLDWHEENDNEVQAWAHKKEKNTGTGNGNGKGNAYAYGHDKSTTSGEDGSEETPVDTTTNIRSEKRLVLIRLP